MDYFKYTIKARLDKAINTLLGILQGIAADRTISKEEWILLGKWTEENKEFANRHPYNGRKIEKAIQLRHKGSQILIIHEADFFDAMQ